MKTAKKQAKPTKPKKPRKPRAAKASPPKVWVYDKRLTGQPGMQSGDLVGATITFGATRCDGLASPSGSQNAGTVPLELSDNLAKVNAKIIKAAAEMYGVKEEDVDFLY